MQAQLNKAAQKDSLAVAQRKIQVCTGTQLAAAPAAAASAGHGSLEMRGQLGTWGCLSVVVWSVSRLLLLSGQTFQTLAPFVWLV
jgi:hypothetical protein